MWGRTGQGGRREVVLVIDGVRSLVVVRMMLLLSVVWMMVLVLELGHLHAESLVGLPAVHHDMLPLVSLAVHGVWIETVRLAQRRRSRGRGSIVIELQSSVRRTGSVAKEVSLMCVLLRLRLKEELPGPRLLEPVGTICHLTWQTRPEMILVARYVQRDSSRVFRS